MKHHTLPYVTSADPPVAAELNRGALRLVAEVTVARMRGLHVPLPVQDRAAQMIQKLAR